MHTTMTTVWMTREIESYRCSIVLCRFSHLFIIHSFTPSKRKMYKGHCSREPTRQHTVPERIKNETEKNYKKKIRKNLLLMKIRDDK